MEYQKFSREYRVERLKESDIPVIYELCAKNEQYYRYCPPFVSEESILADMRALPQGKTYADKYYLGYYDESERLVAVMDFINGYPDPSTAFLGFFMVAKELQGNGTGSAVISELQKYLSGQQYSEIRLGCAEGNEQSRGFWMKNGFEETGISYRTDDYRVIVLRRKL